MPPTFDAAPAFRNDVPSHPAADLFPLLDEQQLRALADDIRVNGLKEAIVMHEGQILDGRNRWIACGRVGVARRTVQWNREGSPTAYVLSMNLHRRHLNESQRAMVGARAMEMFKAEAHGRQAATRAKPGERVGAKASPNLDEPAGSGSYGRAADQAAALVNVSPSTVYSAAKVLNGGSAALVAAVETGAVAVSRAARIADLPKEEQLQAMTTKRTQRSAKPPKKAGNKVRPPVVGNRLSPRARAILADSPVGADNKLLTNIGRYPIAIQAQIAELIATGEAKTIKEARAKLVAGVSVSPYQRALASVLGLSREEQVRLCREVLARGGERQ